MMVVVGLPHLFAPQMMRDTPRITLTSVDHHHIIRAAQGGADIGIGALFLSGLADARMRRPSLIAVAMLFTGFAAGRIVRVVLDGVPAPLYLGVLAFEITFAASAPTSLPRPE